MTNKLLHSLIREQNRAMYELVQAIDEEMSEREMSDDLAQAYQNAEALCQLPTGDDDDGKSEHTKKEAE